MGSGKSKGTPVCKYENDNTKRFADVYFVRNRTIISHWSVVFVYDDCYIIAEGLLAVNPGGKVLKPKYTKTRTKPDGKYYTFREMRDFIKADHLEFILCPMKHVQLNELNIIPSHQIENVRMSPQEIYYECMNNNFNDQEYVVGVMDCQVWALYFAKQLEKYQRRKCCYVYV